MSIPSKTIEILFFAKLREQAGKSKEVVETSASNPEQLYLELRNRHGFDLPLSSIRVAIGDEFANLNTTLKDGDQVAYIPPVAGG